MPATGREFSTGIHTDEASYKRLPDTVTKAACPHCGQLHGLRKQITELDEDVMAGKLIDEINLSSYEIVKKAGTCGHVVDLPAETKTTREP